MASRKTLPFAVVGTPPFVITRPVLSMLFRDPAREPTLVPARWNPVLMRPEVTGLRTGLLLLLTPPLNEVPARANLLV